MNFETECSGHLPAELIAAWKKYGVVDALPIQREAIEKGLLQGESMLVIAPTSSGKTFLGEIAATQHALRGSRAIYLVPFKAIAEERFGEFTERYRDNEDIGLRCIVSDRDHHENDSELIVGKFDIAILTYEKLAALLVAGKAILDVCGCIIVDEVQMVTDPNRGATLELLLTKLRRLENRPQILCLSAVLGQLSKFDEWLGVTTIRASHRPIELRQGILVPNGTFEYREWNSRKPGTEKITPPVLSKVVGNLIERGEQVLIFVASVKRTEEVARSLANSIALPAATTSIAALKDEADTETREILLATLRNGIALHNADCELPERLTVEQGFRNGEIRALVSTTTLAMGINMPVDNVILADNLRWRVVNGALAQVPWLCAEVQNLLGRAGRFGKSTTFGRGIVMASTPAEKRQFTHLYLETPPEPIKSAFMEQDIDRRVLDVVATGFANSEDELISFLFDTFAGQVWVNARASIEKLIREGIQRCIDLELFEKTDSGVLRATTLGSICAAQHCSLDTFSKIKNYVLSVVHFDHLDVAFAGARTSEVLESIRRIKWNDSQRNMSIRERLNQSYSENKLVGLIQEGFAFMMKLPTQTPKPEFTIAAVCEEILQSDITLREICRGFRISGGNLRQMCESVSWMVDIMGAVAGVLRPELSVDFGEVSSCLRKRAPVACRFLDELPAYVSRDERIRLVGKGFQNTEQVLEKAPSEYAGIMSTSKAERVLDYLFSTRKRTHDYWLRDHKRRLDKIGMQFGLVERMYSAKGTDLEAAIEELLNTDFVEATAQRITDQNAGEPDILLHFSDAVSFSIQVTAKESNAKFVDSKKAGDIIPQSVRFGVDGFICIGRPDFETLARENAGHLGAKYNYKQLPVFVLCELFVLFAEKRFAADEITKLIRDARGYIDVKRLFAELKTQD
ncbi:MAG: hypothetical protein RLZZ408_1863 [Verrucomicrobiota bacterium]|jgi:replicative superfamily II helicase